MNVDELHTYWRAPGPDNTPDTYLSHPERSAFVAQLISTVVPRDARVVELGCNAGANLASLHTRGFTNLEGVEISPAAVEVLNDRGLGITVRNESIEDFVKGMGDYDVVFTLAVLEHVHPDSEWVFETIARRTRFLLTVEDESASSWKHFPRNYGKVFGEWMTEVLTEDVADPELEGFVARLFEREDTA